jgi:hypothetical protein
MSNTNDLRSATITALTGSDQQAVTGSTILMGFAVNDAASGTVEIRVYNGTSNSGDLVAIAKPADGGHEQLWLGTNGVHCPDGVYVDVISGTPSGSIFSR